MTGNQMLGAPCAKNGNPAQRLESVRARIRAEPLEDLSYARMTRCCSFYPSCYKDALDTISLPYPVIAVEEGDRYLTKFVYFSMDGTPRTITLTDSENGGWKHYVVSVPLRGNAICSWLSGSGTAIRNNAVIENAGWFGLSTEASDRIVREERADALPLMDHLLRRNGVNEEMFECGFDFSPQMDFIREILEKPAQDVSSLVSRIMPARMLVPPIYPFTVPLDTGQRCSREKRCLMCTLPLARNDASIELTKSKIREWADTIGYLALSTQSVFLGRESLPRNLPEILECLKSGEIYGIIAGKLQYDFEANLDNRIRSWGNLAKFSSFARPSEINAMGAGELEALRKLGLSTVFISAETGSDRIRREALGKEYENGEIESAVDKVLRAGMACKVIFMLGIGGEKSRSEHVESTAALMSRLVSLAEKKFRLMFLFSPLEFDSAGAHLQRAVGRPGMAEMMNELHEIGRPSMNGSGLSSYTSIGARLALPDKVSAHFQIYHYPSLFV